MPTLKAYALDGALCLCQLGGAHPSGWLDRGSVAFEVWDGCVVGASLAVLHASFCAEPGPDRAELFRKVVAGVSLQGWPGLVLELDWPIFDLIATWPCHSFSCKTGRPCCGPELWPLARRTG